MGELNDIDYKGIGEGLFTVFHEDVLSSDPTINLNDDWDIVSSHREPQPDNLTTELAVNTELEIEPKLDTSASPTRGAQIVNSLNDGYLQQNLTPLERYCYHVQTHEQVAMGQISCRQSLTQPNELNESLKTAARLLSGFTPQFSASSWSVLSSTSSASPKMVPTAELNHLVLMMDSSEWQFMLPEEQAECLRRIAKLRRRLKTEGGVRKMKSVRVRKRSKESNKSNEAIET
ncbi:hypothetical protein GGS24DRAFT_428689 [Hypoxylon argillaceum]|nr:hypothetical protein GGS24DRAFT_428689 [Hypoxylon argillaceum]